MISAQSVCLREIWERELGTEGGGGLLCCRAWLMLGSKPASLHHSFFFVVTFLNGDDPVQSQSMFVTAPSVLGMDRRSLMKSWSWARHFHQTVSAYIPDLPLLQRGEDVLHNCSYSTWMKHVSMHVLPVIHDSACLLLREQWGKSRPPHYSMIHFYFWSGSDFFFGESLVKKIQ